jgi:hypothetical protein
MATIYKGQGGLEIEETNNGVALSVNNKHVGVLIGKCKISIGDVLDTEKPYLVVGNFAAFPLVEDIEEAK